MAETDEKALLAKVKEAAQEAVDESKCYRALVDRMRVESRAFRQLCQILGIVTDEEK